MSYIIKIYNQIQYINIQLNTIFAKYNNLSVGSGFESQQNKSVKEKNWQFS